MKLRSQFRLRSLFLLTAVVAVGCLVMPPVVHALGDELELALSWSAGFMVAFCGIAYSGVMIDKYGATWPLKLLCFAGFLLLAIMTWVLLCPPP